MGLGFFGGQDGTCEPCLRGDFVNCLNLMVPGLTTDGGYAEATIAEAGALRSIPDNLDSAHAAPLLCAGVTTYNALHRRVLATWSRFKISAVLDISASNLPAAWAFGPWPKWGGGFSYGAYLLAPVRWAGTVDLMRRVARAFRSNARARICNRLSLSRDYTSSIARRNASINILRA